ncbi:ABC transporter ATP-binding protein [Devosia sediminis]|uniref:Sn-glycerol-3-phosphate ABC transporter ATP-binding protein UgpC n=1 Tax=Devosia sediminis TaxID=2798801 RepID=A0A934J1D0_9HYPH|nr:sn-glycerol-3-phosphate ABC transporter ATP-binding protein UgpC [Devosia sediminis]MBJ3785834.1 sn-glycerol-3-phosphate ABC transporter ATP-binding protein UgpC [Devosia sediminis]
MADLKLMSVRKSYGQVDVIHGVDLEVNHGEFVVFVGPSGCGKSTLLRMIAGLEDITGGDIIIDGTYMNDVDATDRGLAMVFQSYALYPHMTVRKNLSFGLEIAKVPRDEIERRVAEAARILKIEDYLDRHPAKLSGGQRQRVAIGRAIVREPKIFLFDEPLSNLDAELRVATRVEIAKLHERLGATMIYVTHDQVEAMTMADKIVVLRNGIVEQVGAPLDLYNHPANLFVAGFIGSPKMNLLDGHVADVRPGEVDVEIAGNIRVSVPVAHRLAKGDAVTLGIRPEHFLRAGADAANLKLTVDFVEGLGGETLVYGALPGASQPVIVKLDGQHRIENGTSLSLAMQPDQMHLFDSNGRALQRASATAAAA